ncbi:MAG: hypothetical protein AAGB05_08835 [Pseudomonadota bacterium]
MNSSSNYRARSSAVRSAARDHLRQLRAERLSRHAASSESEPLSDAPVVSDAPSGRAEQAPTVFAVSQAARENAAAATQVAPEDQVTPCAAQLDETEASDTESDELEIAPEEEAPSAVCREAPPEETRETLGDDVVYEADLEIQEMDETVDQPSAFAAAVPADAAPEPYDVEVPEEPDAEAPTTDTPSSEYDQSEQNLFVSAGTDERPEDQREHSTSEPSSAREAPIDAPDADTDLYLLPGIGPGLSWMLQRCEVTSLAEFAEVDPEVLANRMGLVGEILNLEDWVSHAQTIEANRA